MRGIVTIVKRFAELDTRGKHQQENICGYVWKEPKHKGSLDCETDLSVCLIMATRRIEGFL